MFYSTFTSFYVCILILSNVSDSDANRAGTFAEVKSPDGHPMCATDEPDHVDFFQPTDMIHCGIRCLNDRLCQAYNFNNGKCDVYHQKPTNYAVIPGCVSHAVKGTYIYIYAVSIKRCQFIFEKSNSFFLLQFFCRKWECVLCGAVAKVQLLISVAGQNRDLESNGSITAR